MTPQLYFDIIEGKGLVPNRMNTDYHSVKRGTLQHEIFWGDKAATNVDFNGKIKIKVNCKKHAMKNKDVIPYSLFVTFEVGEGIDVDIYNTILNEIKQPVAISNID